MGQSARTVLGRTIPWVAVVLVSVFALTQVRARFDARSELVKTRDEMRSLRAGRVVQPPVAGPSQDVVTDRERALDEALTAAREAHGRTRDRLGAAEEALRAERERAERSEALRATQAARAEAAARRIAELEAQAAALRTELEDARAEAEQAAPTPVERWVADAASGEQARVAYARACAKEATPEQVDGLRSLLARDRSRSDALVRLAQALPASDEAAGLVADLLLACGPDDPLFDRVEALGKPHLLVAHAVGRLLDEGDSRLRSAVWLWIAKRWGELDADTARALAQRLARDLRSSDPQAVFLAGRALAHARLRGFGPHLLPLLEADASEQRVAAAHALTYAPDLQELAPQVRPHLRALLADEARGVRTAGLLLAERVLGEKLDFDPAAGPAERAAALARLKGRLAD